MSDSEDLENPDEVERTWNKLENNFKKIGLKDGIAIGRESSYQQNFDEGFIEGFRNGFAVGQYKALAFLENSVNEDSAINQLLKQPKRGWCQICDNKEHLKSQITEIKVQQTEVCNENLKQLYLQFGSKFASTLQLHPQLED